MNAFVDHEFEVPRVDFLSISFPKDAPISLHLLSQTIFQTSIYQNPSFDFYYFDGIEGLTIVDFFTHRQIQLSSQFFLRPNAFEESKMIFREIMKIVKVEISRVDIRYDFLNLDVEDVIPREFAHSKYFPHSSKEWKPGIIGNPAETIQFKDRHKKLRVYNKIRSLMRLVEKKLAKPSHIFLLRQYSECLFTRFEIELRSNNAKYASRIYLATITEFEFAQQVLNNFLSEHPFVDHYGDIQELWKKLFNPNLTKIKTNSVKNPVNKLSKDRDINNCISALLNKAEKWGMSEDKLLKQVLERLGFINSVIETGYFDEKYSYQELLALLFYYQSKYGPPPKGAGPEGEAA